MSQELWNKAASIAQDAFDLPKAERAVYVEKACGGDSALREEAGRLLLALESDTGNFMRKPALAGLQSTIIAVRPGSRLAHFRLEESLGEGGMGVVFKAFDERLSRTVAIKLLRESRVADPGSVARFIREAKLASSLDHPNLATIHDIDTDAGGRLFIVMAYYEGRTIRQRLQDGPMPLDEALDVALQSARGLAKAHAAGIIHRDIKPGNLIVTSDHLVKILDFGIATLEGAETITEAGSLIGTIQYMSPEQAAGETVDQRTDIWSLGVVLFEMLTGQSPFQGSTQMAILKSISSVEPAPVSRTLTGAPLELDAVMRRMLAKRRDGRFGAMQEAADALSSLRDLSLLPCSTATGKVGDAPPVLAVLPFAHHGAGLEAECFSDGITEELINALSRLPRIRVIARTTAFQFKGKAGDIREIGTTLGATAVLEGSVRMAGNRVRISTQLVSVADGCDLWAERFDRTMEDIFAVQDEIAQAISRKLQARFQDQTDSTIIPKVTAHPEAYRLYLRGRFHVRNRTAEGLAEAATYFRQAIELDPAFASAWSGLAGALLQTAFWGAMPPEESGPQIRAAAGEALRIDPESGEAHAALGAVSAAFDWNWNEAKQLFRRAMELEPGNPLIRSSYVAYILAPLKMLDEAVEIQKANLVLDPLSAGFFTTAAIIEMLRGRQAQAVQYATKALAISPKLLEPHILLGNHSLEQGDVARALEHYQAAKDSAPEDPYALSMAAAAFSRAGRRDLAAGIQEQLQGLERTRYVPPVHKARVHMALDQAEDALALLELAVKRRDNMLIFLNVFPVFEPVRTHPRFLHMLEQVGLPAAAGSIA